MAKVCHKRTATDCALFVVWVHKSCIVKSHCSDYILYKSLQTARRLLFEFPHSVPCASRGDGGWLDKTGEGLIEMAAEVVGNRDGGKARRIVDDG
jgi:hypothetical protein